MAQPSVHGRFIWQELMSADTGAAGAFYAKVVGWRTQAFPDPGSSYSMFVAASGPVGGLTRLPDNARDTGARPQWVPYIGADDIDATVAAVGRLGGKVLHAATDIENVGRYAVLADPQGAKFGVYKPLQPAALSAKSQPQPGEIAWQELATSDYEAAFKFYSELFGWQLIRRMDMGAAGAYLLFGRDGVQRGGIYKLSAPTPAPYWLSYIEVANADAVVGPARDAGGQVIREPMDVPGGGRIAQLLDPSGAMFAVHTAPKAMPAKPAATKPAATKPAAAKPAAAKPAAAKPAPAKPAPAKAASAVAAPRRAPAAKKAAAKKTVAKKAAAKKAAPRKAAAKKSKSAKSPSRTTARGRGKIARGKAPAASKRRTGRSKSAAKSARAKTTAKSAKRPAKKATRRAAGKASRKK